MSLMPIGEMGRGCGGETDCASESDIDYEADYVFSPVSEIDIDFDDGEISGSCEGCTGIEVAEALERVARRLRAMGDTPSYIGFDEGKLCSG